jgi:ribose transport system ATP-binding protein
VPELTVEENLFLGREITAGGFLNRAAMRARARAIVRELNSYTATMAALLILAESPRAVWESLIYEGH